MSYSTESETSFNLKRINQKTRKEKIDLKLTRAKEFLGLSALHGPLLLKLQHRCSEDPLDLLRHIPPGLVVLGLGCAARLHLKGQGENSLTLQFRRRTLIMYWGDAVTLTYSNKVYKWNLRQHAALKKTQTDILWPPIKVWIRRWDAEVKQLYLKVTVLTELLLNYQNFSSPLFSRH